MPMTVRIAAALLLIVAGSVTFWRFSRVTREQQATISQLQSEIRNLRLAPAQKSPEANPRGEAPPPDSLPRTPRPAELPAHSTPTRAAEPGPLSPPARESDLAAGAADQLRQRVAELESTVAKMSAENQRLSAAEKELHEKLNAALHETESAKEQVQAMGDRAERIENSYRTLRDETRQSGSRAAELAQWSRELEDVNRRREIYLSNVLRRYRDVTEQYRALATRLERPPESPGPAPGEISRIQNAISMAEEDLRQLQGLNAQAAVLARKYRK